MYNEETLFSIIDIMSDPALILDVKNKTIKYVNTSCKSKFGIIENVSVNNLRAFAKYEQSWENTRATVLEDLKNSNKCVLHNLSVLTRDSGISIYDLNIGFIDNDRIYMCIIFTRNTQEIEKINQKNYYLDMIYSLSFSYPFHLDVQSREIHFIGPILEHFKLPPVMTNYPDDVLASGVLHEDDVDKFKNLVDKMYKGEPPTDSFRAYDQNGKILWYSAEYVVHRDSDGNLVEVVGEFVNIQYSVELEEKLRTDTLTGCYTKSAFETSAQNIISNSTDGTKHALLIIDIDNFKGINDYLGHKFGDIVLQEIGTKLRKIFRSSDLVGRIGGDEFMVLMSDINEASSVEKVATRVIKSIEKTYKGKNKSCSISASIGIVLFPQDGDDFETMYKNTDVALYETKNKGKNGFSFYNDDMDSGTMRNTTPFDMANRAISHYFDTELVFSIFNLMIDATEYEIAMNIILERLGNHFEVDRCYIFERCDNGDFKNTHEWCAEGVKSHLNYHQNLSKKSFSKIIDMANDEGVFYCNDISYFEEHSLSEFYSDDLKSCLCSFVKEDSEVSIMVGFDDCTIAKVWSPVEISTLMYVSKVIALFEKHTSMIEEATAKSHDRLQVLDSLNAFVYIIDIETFEIKHFNKGLLQEFPQLTTNDKCYKVLRNNNEPCLFCPLHKMKATDEGKNRAIIPGFEDSESILINTVMLDKFEGIPCAMCSASIMESTFLETVNSFACGIAICKNDPYSTIVQANDAFFDITGYTRDEMSEQFENRFASIVVDDVSKILEKILDVTIAQSKTIDYTYRIRRKDGKIITIHDIAVYDKLTDTYQVVIMDISKNEKISASANNNT